MIAGIILAGGRASRMGGGDKPLRLLRGRPLLAHIQERFAPQVGALALSANGDPARFAAFGLPVLADGLPDQPGPLAGVLAGLDWAAGLGARALASVSGDTPFLPADLVARLDAPGALTLAASHGPEGALIRHPTVALWPTHLRHALRKRLAEGERRMGRCLSDLGAREVVFVGTPDPFFNINTPQDLALAETLA